MANNIVFSYHATTALVHVDENQRGVIPNNILLQNNYAKYE